MESDSKDIVKKTDNDGVQEKKDDSKPVPKSKKSTRRQCRDSTRERKKNELPAVLMPKFPSQRLVKKKKSSVDQRISEKEEDERTPMCPTDKLLEDEEEVGEKRNEDREEQEEEQVDVTQEPAPPDQLVVDDNPKKSTPDKPPPVFEQPIRSEKPSANSKTNDGKSGRSDNRKTKKGVVTSENKKQESRRRTLQKKPSAENLFSEEDGKKSYKKSKRVPAKRLQIKGNVKSVNPVPSASDLPPATTAGSSPDNAGPEKSADEKARKPIPPITPPAPTPPPVTAPPAQAGISSLKKDQGSAGQKSKIANSAPSSQKLGKKRKKGFLKNVYRKTKFWGRKSDCVADPTTEMLAKSYVPPEYDKKNPLDFQPDVKKWFSNYKQEDYSSRLLNKAAEKPDEIFLNNRPFWLTRLPGDEPIPKVRIQLHRPLYQLYTKSPADILPKQTRQVPFLDPKIGNWQLLKKVDKSIGVEEGDSARDKERDRIAKDKAKEAELKRVTANTFHATMMFEMEKQAWQEQQKKKKQNTDPAAKSIEETVKKVSWQFPPAPSQEKLRKLLKKMDIEKCLETTYEYPLQSYSRKDRPNPAMFSKRAFGTFDYIVGVTKIPRKAVAPTSSSSATSASSKSITKSTSAEGKK